MHVITQTIEHFGLFGVFLVMFIENLGIPFPTEVGFLVTQGLILTGRITYTEAVLFITFSHVTGAVIAYSIGRWGDKKLTGFFARNPHVNATTVKVKQWYARYGSLTVFATRLIGYVRPWSSIVAGFARVPFGRFLFWTTLGSLIFSSVSLLITNYIIFVWQNYPELHILMVILMLVLFSGLFVIEYVRSKRKKLPPTEKSD